MANDPHDPNELTEEEILEALDERGESSLSDEIAKKWDPEKLLRLVSSRAGKGDKLDLATRSYYERKLDADLGDVRVYTGEFAEEVTKAHRAEAVTIGTTGMVLMGGSPGKSGASAAGRGLLAHELTHVAQAQRGVHRKATFGEATPLATEEHEAEAEAVEAEEVAGGESGSEESEEERQERLYELVRSAVLDMFAEDQRLLLMRNGDDSWRP
jgi:hypothetical protein